MIITSSSSASCTVAGSKTQQLEYLTFVEPYIEERTFLDTPYKFSGKELDEETQYYYFGARYYDPKISIWLSVDPLADEEPGWTPYRYGFNNPLTYVDLWGLYETYYVDEKGNSIAETKDGCDDIIVIRESKEIEFTEDIKKLDQEGTVHNVEENEALTEKYGYNIEDMEENAFNLYPTNNQHEDLGFKVGYNEGYHGRSIGKMVIDFFIDFGSGGEKGAGSRMVIGKFRGRMVGKEDAQNGRMNMFAPEIKNNPPKITLQTISP